jgi:alpha-1,2-glucosyltransferase
LWLGILLGALYVFGILSLRTTMPLTDEADHFAQITLFLRGRWELWPQLTTIPGYHVLTAALLRVSGSDSLDAARLVSAAYGLLAIAGFHAVRRRLWPGTETLATAQFAVLPILAPLFFIAYTDALALALLLWACWAQLARREWMSAVLLTLLVAVRQHEIVWLGLVASLAVPARSADGERAAAAVASRLVPLLLPLAAFIAFWAWNGSISLSRIQSALHPDWSLHAGNLLCAVLVAGLLLPLHVLAGLGVFAAHARRRPWLTGVLPVLAAAFWFGFRADNPYNTVFPAYYVHNGLVALLDPHGPVRAIGSGVFAFAACGLALIPLRPRSGHALWPVAGVFLAASWLVELRYAMVPLVLWLALRRTLSPGIEYATLALWAFLAVFLCHATATHSLFL